MSRFILNNIATKCCVLFYSKSKTLEDIGKTGNYYSSLKREFRKDLTVE